MVSTGNPARISASVAGPSGGSYEIVPTTPSTTVSDSDVQSELAKQIAAGKLPPPDLDAAGNVNALYMFDFPPDVSITGPTGHRSCIDFCAYHGTAIIGGKSVPYGIHPDFTGGCATVCALIR